MPILIIILFFIILIWLVLNTLITYVQGDKQNGHFLLFWTIMIPCLFGLLVYLIHI
ncbi:archaellum biogenesis protein FlaJ (TadC family) [Staphylococcus saprophyticus]|jgi:archaellum biogenesis protein FlaJ (TadC family)